MKRILTTLTLVFVTASLTFAAGKYQVNDEALDAMFSSATEISYTDMASVETMTNMDLSETAAASVSGGGDKPIIAWLLSGAVGYLGIHRAYLGTKALVVVAYILTCGGFAILYTVDYIMLLIGLINGDVSKYVDNPALIMW